MTRESARPFFRCGHKKTEANMAPKGVHAGTGKPAFRCRICFQEKDRKRFQENPRRREASIRRAKTARARKRGPTTKERMADLERENAILRQELDATVQALIEARRDRDGGSAGDPKRGSTAKQRQPGPSEETASPKPSQGDSNA